MPRFIDLTGQRFHRLTVIQVGGTKRYRRYTKQLWLSRCDCGNELIVSGVSLRSGNTRSCGCLKSEVLLKRITTHGKTKSRCYGIWRSMRQRCSNPKNTGYVDYGGRGITVCQRWNDSFEAFYSDMGEPTPGMEIDRYPNNDGGYCCGKCQQCVKNGWPMNCRWATRREQVRNSRHMRFIEFNGLTQCLRDWAKQLGITEQRLIGRLQTWPQKRALTESRYGHKTHCGS
jgi:hypothetical protein